MSPFVLDDGARIRTARNTCRPIRPMFCRENNVKISRPNIYQIGLRRWAAGRLGIHVGSLSVWFAEAKEVIRSLGVNQRYYALSYVHVTYRYRYVADSLNTDKYGKSWEQQSNNFRLVEHTYYGFFVFSVTKRHFGFDVAGLIELLRMNY